MTADQTLQSIADVLAANEQHLVPLDPNRPELHWRDITGLPTPRPVPSPEDRMAAARTDTPPTTDPAPTHPGRSFRTWMSDTDRDQLDARAAAAEGERDEALDARDVLRVQLDTARAELGAAQELIAVVDDLAEQLDRARARYATRPDATPVEPLSSGRPTPRLDAVKAELSLTQQIAHRLRTHQWYDNPQFPILHEPSAHGTHEGTGFTTDCAICTKKIDAIAEVAASVISERPDTAGCGHTPEQAAELQHVGQVLTEWRNSFQGEPAQEQDRVLVDLIDAQLVPTAERPLPLPPLGSAPPRAQEQPTGPARTIADGKPFRWDPSENCYCGGPEEIYPHRHGTGKHCKARR